MFGQNNWITEAKGIYIKYLNERWLYRVFDNERHKVWAYCLDQKSSLELKTGGKMSMSLVHFDKYMSN
jgi:hypothetical protein